MSARTALTALTAPAAMDKVCATDIAVSIDDWDVLFDAVIARLRLCVAGQGAPAAVTDAVLDCAQALERLHACRR